MIIITITMQMAEAALADEWVINGDRVALQRRVLRLGKPPRRWKRPSWAAVAMREPLEVVNTCHAHPYCLSVLTTLLFCLCPGHTIDPDRYSSAWPLLMVERWA